jgi:aryl-alcohol dehydrogenase-like predicted oxidoreductase
MHTRLLGNRQVSAIGLGAMPMSIKGRPTEEDQSLRTIHAALDAGVTLIDTADAYCLGSDEVGHNERLIAKGLATYGGDTADVLVATKGGHTRPGGAWELDGSPKYLISACEASLKALGAEAIGLYQFHRPDPKVPYSDSIGALVDLLDAGKIRLAGISNATVAQIDEANAILDGRLASVQNEYSPRFRSSEMELAHCDQAGIAFLPWSPLGGIGDAVNLRQQHPVFARIATAHDVSPQQVCLAWELAKAPVVLPIPGSKRPETIVDSARAADLQLTVEERAELG